MAETVDVAQLVQDFGNFYINQGQNMNRLRQLFRERSMTPSVFTPIVTEDTVYRHSISRLGSIVQQFQKQWTPKGKLQFEPREIRLRNIKIDHELYPDEVKETWLGFLSTLTNEQDRKAWPLIRYMLEMEVAPQKEQDMELNAYYKGKYVAPVAGVAGTASKSLDGIKELLVVGTSTGNMNDYTSIVGALDESTIFDQLEAFASEIHKNFNQLNGQQLNICLSPYWRYKYLKDKRQTLGQNINYDPNNLTIDFLPNMNIVGLPSMNGTDDMFASPKANMLYCRRTNGMSAVRVENVDRLVKLYTDWYEGLGFAIDEYVFAAFGASESGSGS
jgi:hypothetical protein